MLRLLGVLGLATFLLPHALAQELVMPLVYCSDLSNQTYCAAYCEQITLDLTYTIGETVRTAAETIDYVCNPRNTGYILPCWGCIKADTVEIDTSTAPEMYRWAGICHTAWYGSIADAAAYEEQNAANTFSDWPYEYGCVNGEYEWIGFASNASTTSNSSSTSTSGAANVTRSASVVSSGSTSVDPLVTTFTDTSPDKADGTSTVIEDITSFVTASPTDRTSQAPAPSQSEDAAVGLSGSVGLMVAGAILAAVVVR